MTAAPAGLSAARGVRDRGVRLTRFGMYVACCGVPLRSIHSTRISPLRLWPLPWTQITFAFALPSDALSRAVPRCIFDNLTSTSAPGSIPGTAYASRERCVARTRRATPSRTQGFARQGGTLTRAAKQRLSRGNLSLWPVS